MKDINATVIVDISKNEEELMNSLRKQTRTGIRKAMKSGLIVEESQEWEEAYEIYKQTRERNNLRVRSLEGLKELTHKLFVCKKDGKIIAINLVWFTDIYDSAVPRTMTNAYLPEFSELRPNDLLYWHIFNHYRNLGYKKFDLGGYAVKARENLAHINKFKESFGDPIYFYKEYPFFKAIGRKLVRNSDLFWKLNKKIQGKNFNE